MIDGEVLQQGGGHAQGNPGVVDEGRKVSFAQVLVYELRVRDAMTKQLVTAGPHDTLRAIQRLMKTHRISGVPITDNGKLLGVVTIEDIINALDQGHINDAVDKWMTRNVITLRDDYSLVRAVAEFDRNQFGRFPVLDAKGSLVGIITQGDITACLMHRLEKRAEEALAHEAVLVASRAGEGKSERPQVVRARVKSGDFESAGKLSQQLRQILRTRGIDPEIRRRAAIVAYETETNIIIHSLGGHITATVSPDRVLIEAEDAGPGIEDVNLAMQEGWSTAGAMARELGFGAGLGLPNMKKLSDHLDIKSKLGSGTRVRAEVLLAKPSAPKQEAKHKGSSKHEATIIVGDDAG
ncbi:MAG: CBS domain-containing protein [Verrucomicrobiia bacterium]